MCVCRGGEYGTILGKSCYGFSNESFIAEHIPLSNARLYSLVLSLCRKASWAVSTSAQGHTSLNLCEICLSAHMQHFFFSHSPLFGMRSHMQQLGSLQPNVILPNSLLFSHPLTNNQCPLLVSLYFWY